MLLNLKEEKHLRNNKIKKSHIFKSIIIYFLMFFVFIISISNSTNVKSEPYMSDYTKKVYEENIRLKQIINTKIKKLENKNDSLFKIGLSISDNVSYSNIDLNEINITEDNINLLIDNNYYYLNSIEGELNKKLDSIYNVPVFMPISSVDLYRISDYYGWRKHPIKKRWIFHNGIDITAQKGTNIISTSNGVVIKKVKSRKGYGNRVVIDHQNGFKTLYAHLSGFNVNIGDTVKRGDIIGYMGSTGLSTGTHLHYEVIKNNKNVNPIDYMYILSKK